MSLQRVLRSWSTKTLLLAVLLLGTYLFFFEAPRPDEFEYPNLDPADLEEELDTIKQVRLMTYEPPNAHDISETEEDDDTQSKQDKTVQKSHKDLPRTLKFHKIWSFADASINIHEMFPDTPDVDVVLNAMRTAHIVNVEKFDMDEESSGTSEKWLIHLEGGQRAVMKIAWEEKGHMKEEALCNVGYEMPHGEIAAFHLHRLLGFRNTPYVTGRKVDLKNEIFPVASPRVASQISFGEGNQTCVTGKCYYCDEPKTICPPDGIVEASIAYWVPRKLKLYTHSPDFMPWSTPRSDKWNKIRFNDKSYCQEVRRIHPYEIDRYYHDLFDFAVVDTLMYHYDSKHYLIYDNSEAHGLTIRLDHGRAFCANDRDDEHIFMAPITQCCMVRWATHDALSSLKNGVLVEKLREELARDPLYPLLDEEFYAAINRRQQKLLNMLDMCGQFNGGLANILVG